MLEIDAFWAHNDLLTRNILVALEEDGEYKCHVIDFGMIFSFKVDDSFHSEYRKEGGLSPIAFAFLTNDAARRRLSQKEGGWNESTWTKYAQLGYEAQRYKVQWMMIRAMLFYVDIDPDMKMGIEGEEVCESDVDWPCIWCVMRNHTLTLIRLLAEVYSANSQRYLFIQFASDFLMHLENGMAETKLEFECPDEKPVALAES